jgi:hypothetical protein
MGKQREYAPIGSPAEVDGGNPDRARQSKLGRPGNQTGGSLNVKDRLYNQPMLGSDPEAARPADEVAKR